MAIKFEGIKITAIFTKLNNYTCILENSDL